MRIILCGDSAEDFGRYAERYAAFNEIELQTLRPDFGFVSESQISLRIREADVLVLSSRLEGQALQIIDKAERLGTPQSGAACGREDALCRARTGSRLEPAISK